MICPPRWCRRYRAMPYGLKAGWSEKQLPFSSLAVKGMLWDVVSLAVGGLCAVWRWPRNLKLLWVSFSCWCNLHTFTCRYGPCLKKFCSLSQGSVLCSNYWWNLIAVLVKDTFSTSLYLGNHLDVGIICIQGDNLCDLANGSVILFFF